MFVLLRGLVFEYGYAINGPLSVECTHKSFVLLHSSPLAQVHTGINVLDFLLGWTPSTAAPAPADGALLHVPASAITGLKSMAAGVETSDGVSTGDFGPGFSAHPMGDLVVLSVHLPPLPTPPGSSDRTHFSTFKMARRRQNSHAEVSVRVVYACLFCVCLLFILFSGACAPARRGRMVEGMHTALRYVKFGLA